MNANAIGVSENKRVALSKRARFEIFKRDAFTCGYCGRRPPDVVLEVDHIHPVALGGSSDELNLQTSCWDCNRGKGKRPLDPAPIRPDADTKYLQAQQELAETERFLNVQFQLGQRREALIEFIQSYWAKTLDSAECPHPRIVTEWITKYEPEEIVRAIDLLLPSLRRQPWKLRGTAEQIKYAAGIMRNIREAHQ